MIKKKLLTPRRSTAQLYDGLSVAYTAQNLWDAIDAIAFERKISVSRMAINAGLDPTIFNVSKRIGRNGHPHWISSQVIALLLASVGMSMEEFGARIDRMNKRRRR